MQFLPNGIGVGGQVPAQALYIDETLKRGHSAATQTFGNPGLLPERDFDIAAIDVWAVDPAHQSASAVQHASVLEEHAKDLNFIGITGRQTYSAGFREEVPEQFKAQLRV